MPRACAHTELVAGPPGAGVSKGPPATKCAALFALLRLNEVQFPAFSSQTFSLLLGQKRTGTSARSHTLVCLGSVSKRTGWRGMIQEHSSSWTALQEKDSDRRDATSNRQPCANRMRQLAMLPREREREREREHVCVTMQSEIRLLMERKMQSEARGVHSSGYAKWRRTVHSTPHQYAFVETLSVFQGRTHRMELSRERSSPHRFGRLAHSPLSTACAISCPPTRPGHTASPWSWLGCKDNCPLSVARKSGWTQTACKCQGKCR